jgi:tRNA A37 threonylcarbamoyladenosine modification protein TsaB
MIYLYFSLSSPLIFLALWDNEKCLTIIQKDNARLHSENFLSHLQKILESTNHSLKEISEIYFTSTPGGQTGTRVSLAFLATLQVLNTKIKFYHIDTLLLQAGTDNCISLLTIDSRESKYHVAVYQNKKCSLETQIICKEDLASLIEKFPNFLFRKDFQEVDFLTNFQKLKSYFVLLKNIEEVDY